MDELFHLWLEHEATIEEIVEIVAYRRGLTGDVSEDFGSEVKIRLLTRPNSPLLGFQARNGASWTTYLTVVINRVALDFIRKDTGRCRVSAMARELGKWAVRLEELIVCYGHPLREAIQTVIAESRGDSADGEGVSEQHLYAIYERLPIRYGREPVTVNVPDDFPSDDRADAPLWTGEEEEEKRRMRDALMRALDELEPMDNLIIRLRYFEGFTLARIGEVVGLPVQRVHDRIKRVLKLLRDERPHRGG